MAHLWAPSCPPLRPDSLVVRPQGYLVVLGRIAEAVAGAETVCVEGVVA